MQAVQNTDTEQTEQAKINWKELFWNPQEICVRWQDFESHWETLYRKWVRLEFSEAFAPK